jgi:hypothetical protein
MSAYTFREGIALCLERSRREAVDADGFVGIQKVAVTL